MDKSNTDNSQLEQLELIELSNGLLLDARTDLKDKKSISVPIAEIPTLGAGVSSLIPALRTITTTTTVDTQGLYRLANAGVGDALKVAKNGNYWGAFKTAEGKSKFAQLADAGSLNATTTTVMPIDPATMMMAAALYSIEKKLDNIEEMQKKILSHLQIEKESEVEADLETLNNIITKYKYNWDNEHYIASNHKMVLDIQRTARKNMISYQKKVSSITGDKQPLVVQSKVNSTMNSLLKDFKYYKLSLYTFALASMVEIMLSGNFKEENFIDNKNTIENFSNQYRNQYTKCSVYLEKLSKSSIESNVLKGIGDTGKSVGKFIGSIPLIKEGPVDELLIEGGKGLKKSAKGMENDVVKNFATIRNPDTNIVINRLQDLNYIYNKSTDIYIDNKNVYLIRESD